MDAGDVSVLWASTFPEAKGEKVEDVDVESK
jgi:hypothetical protein